MKPGRLKAEDLVTIDGNQPSNVGHVEEKGTSVEIAPRIQKGQIIINEDLTIITIITKGEITTKGGIIIIIAEIPTTMTTKIIIAEIPTTMTTKIIITEIPTTMTTKTLTM